MQDEVFPHDPRLDALNGPSFTLTVVVTPTDDVYPKNKVGPLYFSRTPTEDAHVGFQVGDGYGDGQYSVRMSDGAKLYTAVFNFPKQPLGRAFEYALTCRRAAHGRYCSLQVDGQATADGEKLPAAPRRCTACTRR